MEQKKKKKDTDDDMTIKMGDKKITLAGLNSKDMMPTEEEE